MSHGRRMLEAQVQKESTSATRDDGRVDDGHLRNISRALNDDGTPVRPVRHSSSSSVRRSGEGRGAEEAQDGGERLCDPSLASPPPWPGVQLSREDTSAQSEKERRGAWKSPSNPQINLGRRQSASTGAVEGGDRVQLEESGQRGAARHIDVDASSLSDDEEAPATPTKGGNKDNAYSKARPLGRDGHGSSKETRPSARRSNEERRAKRCSRSASRGGGGIPSYPADRICLQNTSTDTPPRSASSSLPNNRITNMATPATSRLTAQPPPSPEAAMGSAPSRSSASSASFQGTAEGEPHSRTPSRSPPPVTLTKAPLAGLRAASLQWPITAALQLPSAAQSNNSSSKVSADIAAESCSSHGQRPPPLFPPGSTLTPSSVSSGTTTTTAAAVSAQALTLPMVLMSPASPPLRAGVSPRMLPRHPTRFDPSAAAAAGSTATSFSASRAASSSNTMLPSPSLSQAQQQQQQLPIPQATPRDEHPEHLTRVRDSSVCSALQANDKGRHHEDDGDTKEAMADRSSVSPNLLPKAVAKANVPAVGEGGCHSNSVSPLPSTLPYEHPAHTLSPLTGARNSPHLLPPSIAAVGSAAPEPAIVTSLASPPLPLPDPAPTSSTPYPRSCLHSGSSDSRTYPFIRDFSGFHNSGNDCYGCSALTMLLRSTVFRRALLSSPLVAAVRRYESLVTRRRERRVQWTSGYVDTPVLQTTKRSKKRHRDDGTVAEVCGLPAASTPLPADIMAVKVDVQIGEGATDACSSAVSSFPTRALQPTLDLVETLTLDELEMVLNADLETGRVPVTLHAALAALVRAERWREHMTKLINSPSTHPADRQQLLESRLYHESDRLFDGQVYTYGIRLNAVAALFDAEFFVGEQEDAHELFVALMAKLEAEAVSFQKGCAEVLEERQRGASRRDSEGEGTDGRGDADSAAAATTDSSALSPRVVGVPSPPPIPTAMADAWINTLAQTRLLNIIRCRHAGCQHEIVTDEVCVNLSLHIPEEDGEGSGAGEDAAQQSWDLPSAADHQDQQPTLQQHDEKGDDFYFPSLEASTSSPPPPLQTEAPATTTRPSQHCSVAALLYHSMAFEQLSDYKCDACGLTSSQYQGGCFYTRPPPLLVLQLKRFSTTFLNGAIHIRKNSRPVAVGDTLVVYALPSTEELRERPDGSPLRTVTLSEVEAEVQGRQVERASRSESCNYVAAQEQCFFYNAVERCFTRAAQPHEALGASTAEVASEESSAAVWVTAIRSVYRLQSCVLHLGQSLHYGHYVSDFAVDGEESGEWSLDDCSSEPQEESADDEDKSVKLGGATCTLTSAVVCSTYGSTPGNAPLRRRWRRANDERVEVLGREAVLSRRAGHSDTYLLLYEIADTEWVRCPVDAVLPKPAYPPKDANGSLGATAE
ncbi:putative ubiquitin hydrolase putative cysteine peptidase Clan CA family C19 [Leptomonas seymouri]|uniref:ubiquitinyl hydrolase 1 n=1 Tax=Leptomonas seymouri TaxID=5684 RepID=A0A0N1I2N4_LEPSE|nr:putative ubiquitin hydrolase putative cysteine peptidase Clan CA family C19 [Leptomonas seymouri]|eukprot:KPI84001.1 putative ubiquitin hydrolase putative cysteine peptidase Clan CA family C19 [Leptomonas seymouri]